MQKQCPNGSVSVWYTVYSSELTEEKTENNNNNSSNIKLLCYAPKLQHIPTWLMYSTMQQRVAFCSSVYADLLLHGPTGGGCCCCCCYEYDVPRFVLMTGGRGGSGAAGQRACVWGQGLSCRQACASAGWAIQLIYVGCVAASPFLCTVVWPSVRPSDWFASSVHAYLHTDAYILQQYAHTHPPTLTHIHIHACSNYCTYKILLLAEQTPSVRMCVCACVCRFFLVWFLASLVGPASPGLAWLATHSHHHWQLSLNVPPPPSSAFGRPPLFAAVLWAGHNS